MASIHFTDDDRDEHGFVKAPPPPPVDRSLADLLPPTTDDRRPTKDAGALTRNELISAGIVVPLLLIALFALSRGGAPSPVLTPTITTAPAALPMGAPAATAPPPIVAMLPAYAAPGGVQLGQIEATRAITPVAHLGSDWIQAEVEGSGVIWLRARDFPALAIVGKDLAPRPTVPPIERAPVLAAEPPPAPTQCADVGIPGKEARSCGTEDLSVLQERAKQMWIAAFGGNPGALDSPTPQPMDRRVILTSEETRP